MAILRQVFLLLFFGAETRDGNRADAGGAAERDRERGVHADFFGQHRRGDFVELRAAVCFRNSRAEQTDFAGFFQQRRHQAFFVLFELGDQRKHFLGDEFRGGLADQALVVGDVRGREDVGRSDWTQSGMRRREPRIAKRLSSP